MSARIVWMPWVLASLAICMLLISSPSWAQEPLCMDPETGRAESPIECFDRLVRASVANATEERVEAEGQSQAVAGSSGTTRDFLSSFLGVLGLGGATGDGEALVLDFNNLFFDPGEKSELSLRGTFSHPEVFERIAAEVPEDARSALNTKLEGQLEEFDDLEMSLTWAPENGRFGRETDAYFGVGRRALAAQLFEAAASEGGSASAAAQARLAQALNAVGADFTSTIDDTNRPALEPAIQAAAEATADEFLALQGIDPFALADLINNQPQIYAKVGYRERDELAGRSGWVGSFTWEKSLASFNELFDHCKGKIGTECFETYLSDEGDALKRGSRFKLEIGVETAESYSLSLPDDEIDLELPSEECVTASATYGRYLRVTPDGVGTTRFDLEGAYELVSSDDPEREKERGVVTLTLTQRVSEKTAATLSLIWANKPEYLDEDVDEKLSARVGLKLKVDPFE